MIYYYQFIIIGKYNYDIIFTRLTFLSLKVVVNVEIIIVLSYYYFIFINTLISEVIKFIV